MGAWGFGPMDSDQALDWLANNVTDPVGDSIHKLIVDALTDPNGIESYGDELRVAADVVIKLNFFNATYRYGDVWRELCELLKRLHDTDWPDQWNEPETIRASLTDQIETLERGFAPTTLMDNLGG